MGNLASTDKVVTAEMLQAYHDEHVAPFLGGNVLGAQSRFKQSDILSTSERIVGCDTDGRPMYQKTFSGTMPNSAGDVDATLPSDIDTLTIVSGHLIYDGNWEAALPVHYESATYHCAVCYHKSTNKLYFIASDSYYGKNYELTIQYTKTTDAAGSYYLAGENDYSTDEKIIGTWIDGKPIYRKVVDCGKPPGKSSQKTVDANISGVDMILKCEYNLYSSEYQASVGSFFSNIGQTGINVYTARSSSSVIIYLTAGTEDYDSYWNGYVVLEYTKS